MEKSNAYLTAPAQGHGPLKSETSPLSRVFFVLVFFQKAPVRRPVRIEKRARLQFGLQFVSELTWDERRPLFEYSPHVSPSTVALLSGKLLTLMASWQFLRVLGCQKSSERKTFFAPNFEQSRPGSAVPEPSSKTVLSTNSLW